MRRTATLILLALLVCSCGSKPKDSPSLHGTWYASGESIGYLNIERMAVDLRADSTYRYYYRLAPIPPKETGFESTEAGHFYASDDSLFFFVKEKNGNKTEYDYSRKYRLVSDTTEWPLRISFARRGVEFEVYFQIQN